MATGNRPIYAVRAEAVPVTIEAYQVGAQNFRIRFGRGIGWAPKRYTSAADVLAALLAIKSYGVAEAKAAKAMCSQNL